ncbi:MAG: UDP-3-O-(3-hydroxymyristoyl)glucosamine N-acyltransferase [Proteobacteria bacterium]|nr:UDP-3-O-(3-hydroxymyristoyl)glucosamine N-acyltransferase [Pseudomonadota bacterium]
MPPAPTPTRLSELASELGRPVRGDGSFRVAGLAPLESAGPHDLSFVRSADHASAAAASGAGAFVAPDGVDCGARPVIVSPQPALDFARVAERLFPRPVPPRGAHPQALVAPDAKLDSTASIGAGAVVGAGVRVGARTVVHANATLYPDVEVGADCEIHAGVVLREGTRVGDRVRLHPGVVIGGDGFGYVSDEHGELYKVPQVGRVVIEDDVEIGANTTVDRATLAETRIRRGAKIDNLVQVAHNCDIGEGAVVVGQTGLSGGTVIGRRAALMAQVGSAGHLRVGDGAFVGARAGLHKDVPDGARVWGSPQMEERAWHRSVAALARLPDALRRLRAVERALGLRREKPTPGSDGES